jgi:lipopolysaccharide transport system permease protein
LAEQRLDVSELPVVVYTAGSPLRHPMRLAREMGRDLIASRELAWRLFVRDVSAMYRQSVLGYLWAFAPPLAVALTFTFLNSQQIIRIGDTATPYPAFVLVGTVLWQTFLDSLNSPLKAVVGARSLLTKINFPREALILSGLADVAFNAAIRLVLLVPVFVHYHIAIGPSAAISVLGILGLMLLGLSIGMIITPIGVLFGDVSRGVTLVSGFWMLLTPVVYPAPRTGLGATLIRWNPVTPVLETARAWLTGYPSPDVGLFIAVISGAGILLAGGWLLYRLAMPILVERLGG